MTTREEAMARHPAGKGRTCPDCAPTYCAPNRCYCGHQTCPAADTYVDRNNVIDINTRRRTA